MSHNSIDTFHQMIPICLYLKTAWKYHIVCPFNPSIALHKEHLSFYISLYSNVHYLSFSHRVAYTRRIFLMHCSRSSFACLITPASHYHYPRASSLPRGSTECFELVLIFELISSPFETLPSKMIMWLITLLLLVLKIQVWEPCLMHMVVCICYRLNRHMH